MIDVKQLNSIRDLVKRYDGATLVAATKTQSKDTIDELHRLAPEAVMGENRAQELVAKYDPSMRWHMIGRLQTNKVKYIADKVELVESLDREELASELDRRAKLLNKKIACLVEVNVGGEASKGGVAIEDATEFVCGLGKYQNIAVQGLMSVMPATDDIALLKGYYRRLRALFEEIKRINLPHLDVKYLSAGMTNDYMIALDHGANIVRIGRAIFGERAK